MERCGLDPLAGDEHVSAEPEEIVKKRKFIDALNSVRCLQDITLSDGSRAQCGRRKVYGDFCKQHFKLAEKSKRKARRKNPSDSVRIVYNRLLGGWYVVRGPHQTPLNGRFNSREEAQQWLIDQKNMRDAPRRKNPRNRFAAGSTAFHRKLVAYLVSHGMEKGLAYDVAQRAIFQHRESKRKRSDFKIGKIRFTIGTK
jgi:hypothetical protein